MEKIVEEFIELAQIDTISRKERAICDTLKRKLKELGCKVFEDEVLNNIDGATAGNIIATIDGGLAGSLLFCAHMDRVQNGYGIKPTIQDGKLVSDGTTILAADDLAGVVAILDGLRQVLASGKKFPKLEILFTVCEEIGLRGSYYLDAKRLHSKFGYVLDSPGRIGRIIVSAMGKNELYLDVYGKEAHCAYPEKGKSALRAAIKILSQIEDGRVDEETAVNWSYLESLTRPNTVPGRVHAEAFVLSRNDKIRENYTENYLKVCEAVAQETGCTVEPKAVVKYPAFRVEKTSEGVLLASKALKKLGINPSVENGNGGLDANLLNKAGIKMVGLSTGYGDNHTVNENIFVDDLIKSGQLVKEIILGY
ncbi:MAG: M20/M25/M40 family metallo-hydrolase [Phascolarctobacterium sp.]|nr:M20/M25/M40 family metallo-hydrolase [Phascolarctobacterium sp.]